MRDDDTEGAARQGLARPIGLDSHQQLEVGASIESFDPDALELARFLASEGDDVRLADTDPAPPAATALGGRGITIGERADPGRELGAARYAPGASAVVFSSLFPVPLDDRARFATLVGRSR